MHLAYNILQRRKEKKERQEKRRMIENHALIRRKIISREREDEVMRGISSHIQGVAVQEGAGDALQARALFPEPAGNGRQVVREFAVTATTASFHKEGTGPPRRGYPPPWPWLSW